MLGDQIAEKFDMTKKQGTEVVEFILKEFQDMLSKSGTIELYGFGKFLIRHRPERPGINPATRERITLKAANTPAFKASKRLRDAVN